MAILPGRPDAVGASVTWITNPGLSVFQLRHEAYSRATGSIVAVTEDHCYVPPEWAERILASHEINADAVAIGGSVENGALSLVDWGSFFSLQTANMSPIRSGPTDKINGHVNVSYKRAALADVDGFGGLGALDFAHQRQLRDLGGVLVADDAIRCTHVQSLGNVGTAMGHFHAGRTIAGFRRTNMDGRQWARFAMAFAIPFGKFARIMRIGLGKPHRTTLLVSSPLIYWFLMCQATGQFVGYALGPGDSPNHVI